MSHIEAMKQMLHEMEYVLDCINNNVVPFDGDDFHEALRLGRQAISEAEKQEPVAQCMVHGECFGGKCIYPQTKREWVGLTCEESEEIQKISTCYEQAVELTEAKLKEKNT